MSELCSLFMKVKIKRDQLDEFLKAKPTKPQLDANWTQWWNSREMHGKNEISQQSMRHYEESNNQSIVESWTNDKRSGGFSEYDAENHIWNFGIVFFSENYYEMISGLEFIKSISNYIENDSGNFAIIFDYFWGEDTVNAYLDFKDGLAFFDSSIKEKSDVQPETLKYAEKYLENKVEELSKAFED